MHSRIIQVETETADVVVGFFCAFGFEKKLLFFVFVLCLNAGATVIVTPIKLIHSVGRRMKTIHRYSFGPHSFFLVPYYPCAE